MSVVVLVVLVAVGQQVSAGVLLAWCVLLVQVAGTALIVESIPGARAIAARALIAAGADLREDELAARR